MDKIKELVNYDKETGVFTWKSRAGNKAFNNRFAGKAAGTTHCKGYISIKCSFGSVLAHKLAWFFCYGNIPEGFFIDHINRNRSDNSIKNLRLCDSSQNMWNHGKKPNTKSKFKGVWWHKKNKKWVAEIKTKYKKTHIGCFDSEVEAAMAYDEKSRELHGVFGKTNKELGLYDQ